MGGIVINGLVDVDPAKRDEALKGAVPFIEGALTQDGCLHYAWTADLNLPGRIYVFEEWRDEASLARHLAGQHYFGMLGHMRGFEIRNAVTKKYRFDISEPVYDPTGKPRADFFTA